MSKLEKYIPDDLDNVCREIFDVLYNNCCDCDERIEILEQCLDYARMDAQ